MRYPTIPSTVRSRDIDMTADQAIIMSAAVTAGSVIGTAVYPPKGKDGKTLAGHSVHLTPRLLIGTGLTFATLSFLGNVAPAIAVPLSASIALTAFMYFGIPVLEQFTKEQ